jgi:hypothetical protein
VTLKSGLGRPWAAPVAESDVPRDRANSGLKLGAALLVLIAFFALTVLLRAENLFDRPLLSHNDDATGHVLFTVQAQMHSPVSSHSYLPVVTSPNVVDRGIDNFLRASVANKDGVYFYVSFPPGSFALPTFILTVLGLDPTLVHLKMISLATGLLTAIGIFVLLLQTLPRTAAGEDFRRMIALCGAIVYLAQPEALWSHGNIIWAHVLYQPVLVFSCVALVAKLRSPADLRPSAAVFGLILLGCLIDWSAYLYAAGVFLTLFVWFRKTANFAYLRAAGLVTVAGCLGLVVIFWHWSLQVPLADALTALSKRPASHNFAQVSLRNTFELLTLYLAPLAVVALVFGAMKAKALRLRDAFDPVSASMVFVFACACLETFLFLQHSTWYAYGMLKLIGFCVLLTCFLAAGLVTEKRRRWVPIVAYGVIIAYGFAVYFLQNPASLKDSFYARQFEELEKINSYASKDEVIFTNVPWPLGIELGRVGRNFVSYPQVSLELDVPAARKWLAERGRPQQGKLFVYDRESHEKAPLNVWWPRTKSKIGQEATYWTGNLLAVISFDPDQITNIEFTPSAYEIDASGQKHYHLFLTEILSKDYLK